MTLPLPLEKLAPFMRFIAEKAENVKSPMSVAKLCRQFKEETGTSISVQGLINRVRTYRNKIHEINEFDMPTKVKIIFALGAPIDAGFLEELKKVAEVEVDDQQRIIHFKQKDGRLELSAKHLKLSTSQGEQRDREMIQFLAEKSKTTDKPISDRVLLREFKEKTGCTDTIVALEHRYHRVRNTIYQSSEIDKNTKIKIMFISNAKLSDDVLEELRKDADVEVDGKGKIAKYKSNDGCLELERNYSWYLKIKAGMTSARKTRTVNAQSTRPSKSSATIRKGRKQRRVAYSSSEDSETDVDEDSQKLEDDWSTDSDANNSDDFAYDPPSYEMDMKHIPIEEALKCFIDVKTEEPEVQSSINEGGYYEENFFEYDLLNDVDDMEHIPVEKKPETLIKVKTEKPDGPSTSNVEYHYEENMEHILIEPKPEFFE